MSIDDVRGDAGTFVDKWRARWPEWEVAAVFVPAGQRALAEAWFALQQELVDAALAGADPTPGLAKLAWWQEELGGWAKGARRHPLGQVLQSRAAPWLELGRSLPSLRALRDDGSATIPPLPMAGQGDARGARAPDAPGAGFAAAVADCEHALFGGRAPDDAARDAVLQGLRGERALLHGLASPDREGDPAPDAGGQAIGTLAAIRSRLRNARAGSRPRGILVGLMAGRLARPGEPLPPVRALFATWRAARRAG